jgi:hypothetical protein
MSKRPFPPGSWGPRSPDNRPVQHSAPSPPKPGKILSQADVIKKYGSGDGRTVKSLGDAFRKSAGRSPVAKATQPPTPAAPPPLEQARRAKPVRRKSKPGPKGHLKLWENMEHRLETVAAWGIRFVSESEVAREVAHWSEKKDSGLPTVSEATVRAKLRKTYRDLLSRLIDLE